MLAVHQQPALYSAFVGVGQMVSPLETDRIFYADTLAWAREQGQTGLALELEQIGPPPYTSMLDYETALSSEQEVYPYDHPATAKGEGGFSENFLVPEYTFVDQVHLLAGFMDTFGALYPQIQGVDLRRDAAHARRPGVLRPRGPRGDGSLRALRAVVRRAHRAHQGDGGARPVRPSAALRTAHEFVEFMTTHVQPVIR